MLTLWCMGRSPLMVGGNLPTSDDVTLKLLGNPALVEVTAGSSGNGEIIRERINKDWSDDKTYLGDQIVWRADAADWADGRSSAHPGGVYAALFWTGSQPQEIRVALKSLVGLGAGGRQWNLTNLWQGREPIPPDLHIEGNDENSELVATVPAHGVVWLALDPQYTQPTISS